MSFIGRIHGPINAEDLVQLPDSPWVFTSGMLSPTVPQAHLYVVDSRDLSASEVYPHDARVQEPRSYYDQDLAALDPADFEPHGIDVGVDPDGNPTLYVVHHGVRESIEIFHIATDGPRPTLTWVGALMLPAGVWGNDVAAVAGGGLYVTSTTDISEGLAEGFQASLSGEPTGKVVAWKPGEGWHDVPGSQMNSTNGVAVSADGKTLFIAGWRPKTLVRVSLGDSDPTVDEIDIGMMVDNLTWAKDGQLIGAGCFDITLEDFTSGFYGPEATIKLPSRIVKVHPETLDVTTVFEYGTDVDYGPATTAIEVNDEWWVGSMRYGGLGRFSA